MDRNLFRCQQNDPDIHWHTVGPHHERCAFNLIDLIGYAPINRNDAPPYRLYNVYHWTGAKVAENSFATIPAVKRAGRAWVKAWIQSAGSGPIIWEDANTGAHFWAHADGVEIATMYYCPEDRENLKKGFRVWFGGTYYCIDFRDPAEAKAKVAVTWAQWVKLAKARLIQRSMP